MNTLAQDLFVQAHELEPDAREAFLAQACGDDAELHLEIQRMLVDAARADSFFGDDDGATLGAEEFAHTYAEKEGDQIGPYKLRQQLGEGGFGTVWMAEQSVPISRMVALKVIKAGMDTKQVLARFEAERQAVAMMDHPNIAKVLDAGATATGRPYFAMELVKGIPITTYCDQVGLGTRERLALFRDVCSAINHAHQKGIIHRDIKPSNVMITLHGDQAVVKVIDFGIAKATRGKLTDQTLFTRFEQFIGTPVYMSPEQAAMSGLDIDTRSDIYALGILLYELLVGKPPFDSKSLVSAGYEEMRRIIREVEPVKPSSRLSTMIGEERTLLAKARRIEEGKLSKLVEPDLDWIVMKAIDKDRTRRYETANALAQDIRRFLADEPVTATPPSAGYQFRKFARRHKAAFRVAAMIALLLVAATAVSSWQAVRAKRAEQRALKSEATAQMEAAFASAQKQIAEENLINTEKAEKEATRERIRADREAEAAQQNLFYAHMHLGQQAWRAHRGLHTMRELLARWLPADESPDRRGWEWFYLNSLPYQNLRTLTASGAPNHFSTVAWSLAGKRLAEGTYDGLIRIWDVDREQTMLKIKAPVPEVPFWGNTWLAWSPDGGQLAAGGKDGTVHLWETGSGRELKVLRGHQSPVRSLAFSSDGTRLAAWGVDGKIKIWEVATGRLTADVAHPVDVGAGAWSPDGELLAAGHPDGTVTLSRAMTGARIETLQAHSDPIYHLEWSPDSTRLASTSSSDFFVNIWEVASRKKVLGPLRHSHGITAMAWEPDGCRLATGSMDQTVKIWDTTTGREIVTLRGHAQTITSLAWGPGGRLAAGGAEGSLKVWSSTHDQESSVLPGELRVTSVAWNPDGSRLAAAGDDGKIRLWDPATREVILTIDGHDKAEIYPQFGLTFSLAWSPDGRLLASAGLDGTAKVWEVSSGREVFALPADHGAVWSAAWSPDGTQLAAGSQDGTIRLVEGIEHTPRVRVFQAHEGDAVKSKKTTGVRAVAWSPDGKRLASGGFDGLVKVWDPVPGTELATMRINLGRWVFDVAWSPDGQRLASADSDFLVIAWDAQTYQKLATMRGHNDYVEALTWSPDGTRLASAGFDNAVRIWDPRTGEETFVLHGASGMFSDVSWNPDGARLAAPSSDGQIWIWDATGGFERDPTPRAMPYIDRLAASGTARGLDLSRIAEAYLRAGKSQEALATVKDDALGLGKLARIFYEQGDATLADTARLKALAILERQRAAQPDNETLAAEIADLLIATGRTADAVPMLAEVSARQPDATLLALKVAALQAWFGQDAGHAATSQRMLDRAKDAKRPESCERVAKLTSLRPVTDATQREAALALARRGVELGSESPWLANFHMAHGMAEYRCGHYPEAEQALLATKTMRPPWGHTVDLYRAMSLFQQGRQDEARALFTATEAQTKPFPADDKNPLSDHANADDLILWLVRKEARALLAATSGAGK